MNECSPEKEVIGSIPRYFLYIYIYLGQPRGVFKGSCHCNPSQKWGTLGSNSRSRCFKQMGCTYFLFAYQNCQEKVPGTSEAAEIFCALGVWDFGAFDVRPQNFRDRGTTTDFSRLGFHFLFHFHSYLAKSSNLTNLSNIFQVAWFSSINSRKPDSVSGFVSILNST